jgi:hypothetical protein
MDTKTAVAAHLRSVLGPDSGRASVTFLGTEAIDVLRFGPADDGTVRYVTVGMSGAPMVDPAALVVDETHGPRAELLLTVRGARDGATRSLAVLASAPRVEGLVVVAGASIDLGEPLWPGARFTAVLVGEAGGLVPDLQVEAGAEPVRFFPLLPMTPTEAGWKRVHGASALEQRWLDYGVDLRDAERVAVTLT